MINRQNILLEEQAPDIFETGIFPFPRIVILYDDVPAGQHAIRVLTNIYHLPKDRLQLVPRFWRFDFLEDPEWFALALSDAIDAEIIVIATSSTGGLGASLEKWINSCLTRKHRGASAIVALFGPEHCMDGECSPRLNFLQCAARMAGLDFFAPQYRPWKPVPDDPRVSRESILTNQRSETEL